MSRYRDPFDAAKKLAGKTDPQVTHYLHSSVIVDRNGRIIGQGVNHYEGNEIIIDGEPLDRCIHSEIHALRKVGIRKLSGAVMINYARTNIATNMSRPCPNCHAVLKKLGFRKIFYSVRSDIDNPEWKEENL
jgi:tRNA(Arg) A34 adenosine deaminase TadA